MSAPCAAVIRPARSARRPALRVSSSVTRDAVTFAAAAALSKKANDHGLHGSHGFWIAGCTSNLAGSFHQIRGIREIRGWSLNSWAKPAGAPRSAEWPASPCPLRHGHAEIEAALAHQQSDLPKDDCRNAESILFGDPGSCGRADSFRLSGPPAGGFSRHSVRPTCTASFRRAGTLSGNDTMRCRSRATAAAGAAPSTGSHRPSARIAAQSPVTHQHRWRIASDGRPLSHRDRGMTAAPRRERLRGRALQVYMRSCTDEESGVHRRGAARARTACR